MPAFADWVTRRPAVAAIVLASGAILAMILLALFPVAQRWAGDIRLFEHYAGMTFSGRLGETPFLSWYPPLALVPLGLPLAVGGGWAYAFAFGAEMAAVASVGSVLLSQMTLAADRLRRTLVYGFLVIAATAFIAWRYDIVPAVFTLAALWATSRRHWALAGAALGIATGLKLYAAILSPLLVLHAWRSGGRPAAVRVAVAGLLVGVASVAAYAFFPGASPMDLLAFTASRPLHLESVFGSVVAGLATIGMSTAEVEFGFGSFNIIGAAAESALLALRFVQPLVLAASLAAGAYAIWRRRSGEADDVLALAWIAALLGILISNRVLSPQYLVWILPLVPLVRGGLQATVIGAFVVSIVVFPWLYTSLLALEPVPVTLILVRNTLLVVAWGVAMAGLVRSASAASVSHNEGRIATGDA